MSRVLSFGILWPFISLALFASPVPLIRDLILHLFAVFYTAIHLLSWALIVTACPSMQSSCVRRVYPGKAPGKLLRRGKHPVHLPYLLQTEVRPLDIISGQARHVSARC
jgi:hypothetical protein